MKQKRLCALTVAILLLGGIAVSGSDTVAVSAPQAAESRIVQGGTMMAHSIQGINATWLQARPTGFFTSTTAGLMERADKAISEGDVFGDTLVGVKYQSEWAGAGFHFGAGLRGALESYRLGAGTSLSLGVGAVGGVSYYLTDSVALFLQMQTEYDVVNMAETDEPDSELPQRANSIMFRGGMAY